jgi:hypothetical protein
MTGFPTQPLLNARPLVTAYRDDAFSQQTLQRDVDLVERDADHVGDPARARPEVRPIDRREHGRFVFERTELSDVRRRDAQPAA